MPQYTVTFTDEQQKLLEHDLLDVDEWIQAAAIGKTYCCKKRLANLERTRAIDAGEQDIPVTLDELAAAYMARPEYKNRVEREAN